MKRNIRISLWMMAVCLSVPGALFGAALTPTAVGDAAVAGAIDGRVNAALAANGGVAFSSSDLTPDYAAPRVNDGVINHSGNSWIPLTTGPTEFVGVALAGATRVGALVFHGQTGYNGRSAGTWSLQYTTDAPPGGGSSWVEFGTYTYVEGGCATPMPRTLFAVDPVEGVTGVRLVLTTSDCGIQLAVQELEVYEPPSLPPSILTQPVGGTFPEGDDVVLSVVAAGADSYQWQKGGVDLSGETGSMLVLSDVDPGDAGDYSVLVGNANGAVPSDTATIVVTPAPVFNSYGDAVVSDNPIHYYPMDELSGTNANDVGTLGVFGGAYTGGYTLGQASASARLGTCVLLDGQDGSFVDLGQFHAGDEVSVEAWARLDADARASSFHAIVTRWDGSFELDIATTDTPNMVVRNELNTFGLAVGPAPAARGQWHHLVGVFRAGTVTIYVNGVKGTEQFVGGVLQDAGPSPDRVLIGATRQGIFGFKGCIDEVALYDYALSPAQIRTHYRTATGESEVMFSIQKAVIISWPTFPAGIVLQCSTNLEGPYENAVGTVYQEDNLNKMALPTEVATQKFFQLLLP